MADQFTEEQVAAFKDTFKRFDKDQSDTVKTKDLGTLLRALGLNPTEGELNDLVNEIAEGYLDFSDFLTLLARQIRNAGDEEQLREAFRIFDKEGNDELRHIMATLGEKLKEEEIDEMMKEVEVNNEGQINYEEFVTNMSSK